MATMHSSLRTALFLVCASLATACGSDSTDSGSEEAASTEDGGGVPTPPDSGGGAERDEGTPNLPSLPDAVTLPVVFVHGFAGSAQQFESQAMRFAMNGYPQELFHAYDHHGGLVEEDFVAGANAVVDAALAEHGTDQVYLVGHSRGTGVSAEFLGDPTRATKVAKYISLDGAGCAAADAAGVPCIAPNQDELLGQAHVEVATSKETFALMYDFLVGEAPELVDIVRQPGPVEISGRAVHFPENTGRAGTTLEIYEIDRDTGYRLADDPAATFELGSDGDWGPATVDADAYYELALSTPGAGTQHFYPQRFLRDNHFVRLLSGDPETSPTRVNTNAGPSHAAVVVLRMREWYAIDDTDIDNGIDDRDILEFSTESENGNQPPVDAIVPDVANGAIALHVHDDAATPGETTLEPLPYFAGQPFQWGVDIYMPASEPPDGTITITNIPRGDTTRPQTLNFPNWASEGHFISVMFSDFPVD